MSISEFLLATGNEFAAVAEDGISAGDVSGWVDTGSYSFNALLSGSIYGGLPSNKITTIQGDPGTGKSFMALAACRHFLNTHKDGIVMYFESESAITKQMVQERGIDTRRFGIVPVTTVQEFRTQALKVIDNYEKKDKEDQVPLFFVLDSMGMLSTSKELDDSLAGKETKDMTRASLLKAAFRVLTLRLGRANIPLIVTNHVYSDMGSMYPTKIGSGGSGSKYSSSIIIDLTKAKDKDTSTNTVIGAIISATASKSRFTKEHSKVKTMIRFDGGLDRYYGLLEMAEEAKIFKKVSTRYEFEDGSKAFGKAINANPEKYYTKEVLDRIDEYVKQRYSYSPGSEYTPDVEVEQSEPDEESTN